MEAGLWNREHRPELSRDAHDSWRAQAQAEEREGHPAAGLQGCRAALAHTRAPYAATSRAGPGREGSWEAGLLSVHSLAPFSRSLVWGGLGKVCVRSLWQLETQPAFRP